MMDEQTLPLRSFKLDWDGVRSGFVLPEPRRTLQYPIAWAVGQQPGEEVTL